MLNITFPNWKYHKDTLTKSVKYMFKLLLTMIVWIFKSTKGVCNSLDYSQIYGWIFKETRSMKEK
jgi:hypothetical protein